MIKDISRIFNAVIAQLVAQEFCFLMSNNKKI